MNWKRETILAVMAGGCIYAIVAAPWNDALITFAALGVWASLRWAR